MGHGFGRLLGGLGIYEGMFSAGVANGYGRMIYNNSDYFIGTMKYGKFHGLGQYVFSNGTILKGVWDQGKIEA